MFSVSPPDLGALRITKWEGKPCVPDSEREPVCAYFIEEIVPEQLLGHVKMQNPGSLPRAARPGSFVLAKQANLPFNYLSFSFGHSSCSTDSLLRCTLCVESHGTSFAVNIAVFHGLIITVKLYKIQGGHLPAWVSFSA